ncbi:MAG: hypothetical protein K8R12_00565, partial [Desulfobacterales bacterium]|nr:hypothetical protein [Desulfobacterales bacterium]
YAVKCGIFTPSTIANTPDKMKGITMLLQRLITPYGCLFFVILFAQFLAYTFLRNGDEIISPSRRIVGEVISSPFLIITDIRMVIRL